MTHWVNGFELCLENKLDKKKKIASILTAILYAITAIFVTIELATKSAVSAVTPKPAPKPDVPDKPIEPPEPPKRGKIGLKIS